MKFKSFRLEAVIKRSSNKRCNPRWRKTDEHGLQKVEVKGRQFGVLTNPDVDKKKQNNQKSVKTLLTHRQFKQGVKS